MIEILKVMEIDLNLDQIIQTMIILKEKLLVETTITLKLIEKYNDLAREASSNGDKILSENYLQHADHFTRILNEQENYKKIKFAENKPTENNTEKEESTEKSEEEKNENKDVVAEIKPKFQKKTDTN